jgi:hypothetical protein
MAQRLPLMWQPEIGGVILLDRRWFIARGERNNYEKLHNHQSTGPDQSHG